MKTLIILTSVLTLQGCALMYPASFTFIGFENTIHTLYPKPILNDSELLEIK